MSRVKLQAISIHNRPDCLAVTVSQAQQPFVPDVASSLELAGRYPDACPLAIQNENDQIIGFALYGVDDQTGLWKIFRLMIDYRYQGQGYGKAAIISLIETLRVQHAATEILICYHAENTIARRLYASVGFEEYGQDGSKVLARLHQPETGPR